MASFSSPPSYSLLHNKKHHVFPSFHGADVRTKFLSHIVKEFKSKGIDLFTDNAIERSKSIGPEHIEAISGSMIALVLLSQNYASSTWCLNELVEIIINCQTVIPIFYEVDPTDVKKQTGDFGEVFRKTCKGKTTDEIRRWKQVLAEVSEIAGYHSKNWETEAEMIEDIATDVSNKLNLSAPSSDFDDLVGMESHMKKMEPLLRLNSDEVRKIGIWGPPGIGKTTTARLLFDPHFQDFQLSVFMDNIKTRYAIPPYSDDYSMKLSLQKQLLSQLPKEKCVKVQHLGVAIDRLKDKKVLVVLDDVDHLEQLEAMSKETNWFGPGSRIIIKSQDQKVLQESGIDHIYKENLPRHDEALQMFCMYAFGQKSPYDGFEKLAQEITTLSGGLPVGIRFMGSYFGGKSKKEWENELPRLKTSVDGGLGSILKFTYDALSGHDKEIAHHYISSLRDVKGLSEARQELTITNEDLKLLRNLKWMDLIRPRSLNGLPATNLKKLNLSYCSSLGKLPPPVEKTNMLKKLDAGSCSKLVTLPNLELPKLSQLMNLRYTAADFHPTKWYTKAEMNKAIATDISTKLNNAAPFSEFEGLVGMGDHIKKMEELLRLDLDEVRVIGISGLLGSGKTTIAKYINQLLAHQFQLSTFINIKGGDSVFFHDEHKAKLHLQTQLFSQLINEKDTGESLHLGVAQESFKDKKVLVVLEDVDQFGVRQLEVLVKELRGFGPGSRIIITSQDRKFLKAQGIKHIYKVGFPASDEALQIFCMYAFGQKSPYDGFEKLAPEITTLCGELPAGIRFMGSYFRGKSEEEWENELPRLKTSVDGGLESILKFTYDGLSGHDKEIAHHYISSLRDVELTEKMETFLRKGLSQVRPKLTITNQDVKENVNTSERASRGMSSNGLLPTVHIYCADTLQYSFASHLSLDFHRKGIVASVHCNESLDVKEGASASVVVLSNDYLSSPSCLDTLVRVLQCRRKHVQLVVPVFYDFSPSDMTVPKQESDHRIVNWTSALKELRESPDIHSREESSDCELVEDIVKDVYEKLFPMQQIGINSRLVEIKQLLCKQPWSIRRIGIWGMPGIGKTTLAKAFFDQVSGGYEASFFITHFDKAFHEKGLYRLWDEHFGKILKKIPRVCSSITRPNLPGDALSKKRVLVVLDDVQNPLFAESFLRGFHWFGPGSLIIITSRDKRVFRLCQINHVYEVRSLNKNESLQLFSQCAFEKDIRGLNRLELELSRTVNGYANGNPLALSFYGRELKGKNLSEVKTTFLNFELQTPNMFHDLLKSSYETLNDNEKDIFLDIACFFKDRDVDYVKQLLEGCGLFPHVGIDVLVEKCLVTISGYGVEMHRIIQNFGRELNNKETTWIKRGRRLWEPSTIKFLLEANGQPKATGKGALVAEDIKAISMDTTNLRFDVKPTAFENMLSLRFLKIYSWNYESISGLRLPKGLVSLPDGLRLLHWENYPLQFFPQDFDPRHLIELNMPYSQLQKLWRETKNLDMLKRVRLCHSQQLTEIDDICKALNIELIDLEGCTKLQSFPATNQLQHLRVVNLSSCTKLQSFPATNQLQHLRVVNLSGCTAIKSFPETSPNIEELNLQRTALIELQISIGNANNLKKLNLSGCSSLVRLHVSIGNASNLQMLDLSFCSSLVELPSSIGNATNLESLNLEYCSSLVELPSSIGNVTKLKKLCLRGCSGLVQLPSSIGNATNLQELDLEYCSSLVELPSSVVNATHLKKIYLNGCSSLSPVEEESASHSWTSYSSRLDEKGKQCLDEIEEVEEGSASQEANEPVSLEEQEKLRQEMEEMEAKYQEDMKEMERKRKAIMETKKKLSLIKRQQVE